MRWLNGVDAQTFSKFHLFNQSQVSKVFSGWGQTRMSTGHNQPRALHVWNMLGLEKDNTYLILDSPNNPDFCSFKYL